MGKRPARRPHIERCTDVDGEMPHGGPWHQVGIFSKSIRARTGWDARGLLPGQAEELRGKRWTVHDRRRLGFDC